MVLFIKVFTRTRIMKLVEKAVNLFASASCLYLHIFFMNKSLYVFPVLNNIQLDLPGYYLKYLIEIFKMHKQLSNVCLD